MSLEQESNSGKPLPEKLRSFEERLLQKNISFPVSSRYKVAGIVDTIDPDIAYKLAKWAAGTGILIPRTEFQGKRKRYYYDLDRILVLAQITFIFREQLADRGQPADVLAKLKATLEWTRLEKLVGAPAEIIVLPSSKPESPPSQISPEDQVIFFRPPHSSLQLAELGDFTLGELDILKNKTRRFRHRFPLKRSELLDKLKTRNLDLKIEIVDTIVFLTGARQGQPVSYSNCTMSDFDQTIDWCMEKMYEHDLTLADIIRIIENGFTEGKERV